MHKKKNQILKERSVNLPDTVKRIHPGSENFNMVCNIMLGIKKAIDSTFELPLVEPNERDFRAKCEYQLAPLRTDPSDVIKACTFVDYAPQIFATIRKTFGVKKERYSEQLGPSKAFAYLFNGNFDTMIELCSSGKSGSFFYYTADANFVLKTISHGEFKFLKHILSNYFNYITNQNQDTLISRVLGMHKMIFYRKKGKLSKKIYFIVMNNVFSTSKKIDLRYDLKGSLQGRETNISPDMKLDPTVALKEIDLIKGSHQFKVGRDMKRTLINIIEKDT